MKLFYLSLSVLALLSTAAARAVTIAYWQFDQDGVPGYLWPSVGGNPFILTQVGAGIVANSSRPFAVLPHPDATGGFVGDPALDPGSISSPAETAGSYLQAGSTANQALNLAAASQWTFEGWFFLNGRPGANVDVVFNTRGDNFGAGIMFDIRQNGLNNRFNLYLNDGANADTFQPALNVTTGAWHQFMLAFNGTNGVNGRFEIFMDGVSLGTHDLPAALNRANADANDADRLQLMGRSSSSSLPNSFNGLFDEFRISGPALPPAPLSDWRNIRNGLPIPSQAYADQPYIVVNNDGSWLCTLTTGAGSEGGSGQHVVATLSTNQGRVWSALTDIEPGSAPEASWVVPLKVPSGRVYAFYTYNFSDMRSVQTFPSGTSTRVDTLGQYAFRYSDDGGRTWSSNRFHIPIRVTDFDRSNVYGGDVDGDGQVTEDDPKFFWGVGKPFLHGQTAYLPAAKIRDFGSGFITASEGIVFRSDNLAWQNDPAQLAWLMGPDGESGLRAPSGSICEETEVVDLSDGSLYAVTRTTTGYVAGYYSRDGGHTWTAPDYARYAPAGRALKNPRANVTIRRFANGNFLLWYHNHSGTDFNDRNPGWLCGGVERDGWIYWSQPEILLYDTDASTRISYPDLFEDGGHYYITETQKAAARLHEIDSNLVFAVWHQLDNCSLTTNGLAGVWTNGQGQFSLPELTSLALGGGLTIDFWANLANAAADQVFFDGCDVSGKGVLLSSTNNTFRLTLNDGATSAVWDADAGALHAGRWQHVAVTVDGGPKLITWTIDGLLQDGGASRQYGWGRFSSNLGDVNGAASAHVAGSVQGRIAWLRVYSRALLTSEAIGNFQAEMGAFIPETLNIVSPPALMPGGQFHVGFAGVPNRAYRVDRSVSIDGPWAIGFTHLFAGTDGLFDLVDPNPPAPVSRFYRIVCP